MSSRDSRPCLTSLALLLGLLVHGLGQLTRSPSGQLHRDEHRGQRPRLPS